MADKKVSKKPKTTKKIKPEETKKVEKEEITIEENSLEHNEMVYKIQEMNGNISRLYSFIKENPSWFRPEISWSLKSSRINEHLNTRLTILELRYIFSRNEEIKDLLNYKVSKNGQDLIKKASDYTIDLKKLQPELVKAVISCALGATETKITEKIIPIYNKNGDFISDRKEIIKTVTHKSPSETMLLKIISPTNIEYINENTQNDSVTSFLEKLVVEDAK